MKFSVFEVNELVRRQVISPEEARQLLKIDEALKPVGEPGSVPAAGSESEAAAVLPLSE